MKINYEGKDYSLDFDDVTNKQARHIKKITGLNLVDLENSLVVGDPDALTALFWLMLVNSGVKNVDIDDVDFKISTFSKAVYDAAMAELEAKEAADEAEEAEKRLEKKAVSAKK